jgi:hypothetical protein
MNMANADFEALEKALNLLPHGQEFVALPEYEQEIIINANVVLVKLLKKKKANNARTAAYIAEKRKDNKNYARSIKE